MASIDIKSAVRNLDVMLQSADALNVDALQVGAISLDAQHDASAANPLELADSVVAVDDVVACNVSNDVYVSDRESLETYQSDVAELSVVKLANVAAQASEAALVPTRTFLTHGEAADVVATQDSASLSFHNWASGETFIDLGSSTTIAAAGSSSDASGMTDISGGGGGLALCGCAACVAARGGDHSGGNTSGQDATFLLDSVSDAQPVADGTAGAGPVAAPTVPSYAISALFSGSKWASATVTYSFLTSVPSYYASNAGERANFVAMNTAQQQAANAAFAMYSEIANINFVQVASGTGSINLGTANLGDGIGGWAYYPGSTGASVAGDVWITNRYSSYNNPTPGSWEYQTYIHEIGHALGMKHPGNYDAGGGGTPGPYLPAAEDSHQYTVMSYYSGPSYGSTEPITPQLYDVATIQALYGARTTTRSGNDTYTFSTSLQIRTIWDGGGNDTFNASNQTGGVTVDLRPGSFSSIAGTNNIAIAFGATIENAVGSNYNDTLRASDSGGTLTGGGGNDTLVGGAGNDSLVGGLGVDTMFGGGGADTFIFATGDTRATSGQHDVVVDFVSGTDLLDFSAFDAIASTPNVIDAFNFVGMASFTGNSGVLSYFYDAARSVTVLQGDTNGDRVADFAIDLTGNISLSDADLLGIVLTPVVIEANGSTSLTQIGRSFYLYNSVGSGPSLKYIGANILAGQTGGWIPISAEQAAGGYQLAWKQASADSYMVWNTDSNGNYISNTAPAPGNDPAIQSFETSFHQDLNGDGHVGLVATVIETNGSIDLTQTGNRFYLADAVGAGPSLKYLGADILAGQTGGWMPISAEQMTGGYQVAWKQASADSYMVWNTNSNGNYISNTAPAPGNDPAIQSFETSFQQDLNGDGHVGLVATVIETNGSIDLTQTGNRFYLADAVGAGPSLKYLGADILAGQTGGWTPISAEQTVGGYQVAWKQASADSYMVWNTNSNGNYISNTAPEPGSDSAFQSLETSFHQDLNGDGHVGLVATVIEANGSTTLTAVGNRFYLNDAVGAGPSLKYVGADILAGQTGGWMPISAEQTIGGYQVAWKQASADSYMVWNTDSNGNYISNTAPVPGSNSAFQSLETSFHQDLNGDGHVSNMVVHSPIHPEDFYVL